MNRDNTVSFQNLSLQIEAVRWRATLAGCQVMVHQHLDGTLSLTHAAGQPHGERGHTPLPANLQRSQDHRGYPQCVTLHSCAAHACDSPTNRSRCVDALYYRSRVAICYGSEAGSASVRSSGRLESDRCRESGAAVSRLCGFGSLPVTRVAGFAARPAIHPTVDRATRPAGIRLRARSCLTIPAESAGHRPGSRHRECPSLDTEPGVDSSPGSDLC